MTENKSSESREFTRVPIKVWVEVRAKDTVLKTHESHDLSMVGNLSSIRGGFYLRVPGAIFRYFWKVSTLLSMLI